MSEIEELRSHVQLLESRLTAMEAMRRKATQRQRWLLAGTAVVTALALGSSRVRSDIAPAILNCTALNIVDDNGQTVLSIGHDDKGGVISLLDAKGATRIRAAIGDRDQGEIASSGTGDTKRVILSADKDGGLVRVCGNDGQFRALVACQTGEPNAGLINIRDSKGNQRVNLGSDINGGVLTLGSESETILSRLGTDKRGGNFYLYGPDHRAHVVMATGDGNIGLINTRDAMGLNRVILGYDNDGGQVIVNGTDAKPRAGLVVGDDGSGAISLFDKTGNLIAKPNP